MSDTSPPPLSGTSLEKAKKLKKLVKRRRYTRVEEPFSLIHQGWHLFTDGGTPCNDPRKGYGTAYGSYRLFHDGKEVLFETNHYGRGSNNFAEIETAFRALNHCLDVVPDDQTLFIYSDSEIMLSHLSALAKQNPRKVSKGTSQEMIQALSRLDKLIYQHWLMRDLICRWTPRRNLLKTVGH